VKHVLIVWQSWSNFWYPPGSPKSKDSVDANAYKLLDINLTHPIRTTQLAIAQFLEKKKKGSILHVSSIAGQVANPVTPLYIASKHGISGFVRSLGPLESRFGIRITAVAPGVIKTPLWTEVCHHFRTIFDLSISFFPKPFGI
jgi:3-hydroxybutyrate dehydrogenase